MKKYGNLIIFLFLSVICYSQGHFVVAYTDNGQDHMNLNVISATIEGVNLKAGDEIAAFDGTICCGKIILTQPIVFGVPSSYKAIAASKKDDNELNGFTPGNIITYKFWDSAKSIEVVVKTSDYFGIDGLPTTAPTYTPLSTTFVKLSVPIKTNQTPTANAGPDQSVNKGIIVTLDGSASTDADSDPLTYAWTAPAGITLSSNTAQKPTFTAPEVSINTDFTFSLIVNDGKINSVVDQVVIQVKKTNNSPIANGGADQTINEGVTATLDGSASTDPDSDPLTYLWTAPAGITLSSNTAQKPTFTTPEVNSDTDYTFSLVVNDGMVNSTADQVIIKVKQINKIPTANAGNDQTVSKGVIVTLDGSASTDADSDPLTYAWTAPAGITLSSTTAQKPTFTAPEVSINTDFTFSLIVNDGKINSVVDQVVIQVKKTNNSPIANGGTDQTINEGVTATLDGSASTDPDSDPLTYLWTAPAGITLSSNTAQKPTFTTPEVNSDTDYTFSLVVNDGMVNSTADQVIIKVKQINKIPTANAGPDQTVSKGVVVTLDGSASTDADSDPLTYAWTAPAGISLNSNTVQKPTFTAPEVSINTNFTFSLIVNDGKTNSTADQIIIQVKPTNNVPVANAGSDQIVNEGVIVTLDGSASSDIDNDLLTYSWTVPSGITLNSNTVQKPTFTAPDVLENKDFIFSLIVSDGESFSASDQIIVQVKQVNKTPLANAGPDQSVDEGITVTLDGTTSTDPDKDPLTYLWAAPTGITLSSNTESKPTFTVADVLINTDFIFSLIVNDGKINSASDQVIIQIKQINKAPVANAGTDQSVNENKLYSLDGSGSTDPDNDLLTYQWTAPPGITLSSNTAAKPTFITPDVSANTNFTFSLVVNDGKLNSVTDEVVITIKQDNKAPTVNAGPDQMVNEGNLVMLDGTASTDPDGDALVYLWTAPTGITLSSNTAAKPTFIAPEVVVNVNYTFSLVVNDGTVSSSADQVVITSKQVNKPPVYISAKTFKVNEDESMELLLQATDIDNDPISFSIENLPPFLKLTKKSNTSATLTGIFTNKYIGNYTYKLKLSDGIVNIEEPITISVAHIDHAPFVKDSIKNISVNKRSPNLTIDLTSVFADNDPGDFLTYAVTANANDKVVSTKISGYELILSFSADNSGYSEIAVTAISNEKVATSKFKVEVKIPVGIEPILEDVDVQIYPNPAKENLNILFTQLPKTGTSIIIFNNLGKVIFKTQATLQEEIINLKNLSPGLYFVRIDQLNSKTFKLILD